jgi:hypothetical protein
MRGEDYKFVYHYNTYSGKVGAMTVESVGNYFSGEVGDYVIAETRGKARKALKERLDEQRRNKG